MWNLKNTTSEYNKIKKRTQENKLVVTSWEREEGKGNINIEGKGLGSTNYQV